MKIFLNSQEATVGLAAAAVLANMVPFVGNILSVVAVAVAACSSSADSKELSKTIAKEVDKAIAKNALKEQTASLKNVQTFLGYLKKKDSSPASKVSKVNDIHGRLNTMVNIYSAKDSVFTRNPVMALKGLFSLAMTVAAFQPVKNAIDPGLRDSLTACNLKEAMLEFRRLTVGVRLKAFTGRCRYDNRNNEVNNNVNAQIRITESKTYNDKGYTTSDTMPCNNGCKDLRINECCFEDTVTGTKFKGGNLETCAYGYLGVLRQRVEKLFDKPLATLKKACRKDIEDRKRTPTGKGFFQLRIDETYILADMKGSRCDNMNQKCDLYVIVKLNDDKVFTTTRKDGAQYAKFYETYKSGAISKTDTITIEAWDHDKWPLKDDLIAKWTKTVKELLEGSGKFEYTSVDTKQYLKYTAKWQDEFSP